MFLCVIGSKESLVRRFFYLFLIGGDGEANRNVIKLREKIDVTYNKGRAGQMFTGN